MRRVVLVGAGHAHLHVAAHADRFADDDISLVLVDPDLFWYSGMATGMLAGQYTAAEDRIDPHALIEARGGSSIRARVVAVTPGKRTLTLSDGATLSYDAVSFNVGSEVALGDLSIAPDTAWTVKPVRNLWELRTRLEARLSEHADGGAAARVIVVGAGATGCEVAAAVDALGRTRGHAIEVVVISRSEVLLPQHRPRVSRSLARTFLARNIKTVLDCPVDRIEDGAVVATDGRRLPADFVVVATGLRPPRTIATMGLPCGPNGGLDVDDTLCADREARIFGAGDCIDLRGIDLPKLGVFAVREAPVLLHNLLATLAGASLRAYRPQRRWLTILNLGCADALAVWDGLYWKGALSLRLKDYIDRRFLARYRSESPGPS